MSKYIKISEQNITQIELQNEILKFPINDKMNVESEIELKLHPKGNSIQYSLVDAYPRPLDKPLAEFNCYMMKELSPNAGTIISIKYSELINGYWWVRC